MNDLYRSYLHEGEQVGSRYAIAVPRNVPLGMTGAQLGHRAGASLEFKDHRDYQAGDDLRRIDWSAYARSDRLTVKLYREEVNPHVDIVLDGSGSMALLDTAKARGALSVAAIFASAAMNAHYSHAGMLTRDSVVPIVHGTQRPSVWDDVDFAATLSPAEAFGRTPPRFRRQGIRVFISDLLFMAEPSTILDFLVDGAAAAFVVQLLAKADVDPPQRGNVRLLDCETGQMREVFVDAAAEKRYRNALSQHQENWHRACRQMGVMMTTVIAESLLDEFDLQPLLESQMLKLA